MPPISADQSFVHCQLSTLFLSRKETVKDMREKLTRIYQNDIQVHSKAQLQACKLWKLNPRYDYNEVLSKLKNSHGRVIIKAVKLNDYTVLEDAELGDDDVIICEYKINDEWVFISEEEYQAIASDRCAGCGSSGRDLFYCECKTVKYCNQVCQRNHRPLHREKCIQIKGEQHRKNEIYSRFKISKDCKFTSSSRFGLVGLQNFGNTCFMNTCLQCLSNVWELTDYFIKNEFIKDINRENKLGTGGRLAAAYAELMKEIWSGAEQSISPWDVKRIVGEVAPQFMGYNQQDTQEFLSYLLDGIHEDLNRVRHKPYVELKEAEGRPDEVFAMESWENHLKRNRSVIVDLMHGQYKSKLICPDCQKVSITFDPFSTLSLPIPTQRMTNLPLYFIFKDSALNSHLKMSLSLMPHAPASEVLQQLSKLLQLPEESIELKILRDHQIVEHDTSRYDVKSLKEHDGIPFVYQIHNPYIDPPIEKFNIRKLIRVELIINQKIKKDMCSEPKSFYRMFYISPEQTLRYLHLQAFTIMRVHVANFVNNQEELRKKIDISLEDMTLSILEKQYEDILSLIQADLLPYNLYFVTNPDEGDKGRVLIPYSAEKKISDMFSFDQNNEMTIEITINQKIRTEYMKLNKCKEADGLNQAANESKSYTIYDCFNLFITPEVLDKENTWYCSNCKDQKQATKTMEIYATPKILIIHLKRFRTNRVSSIGSFFYTSSSSKITSLIEYPVVGLDLRNYVRGTYENEPIYDLFAISNHYGGMGGGHYTAYAKNHKKNAWYDFNDSMVSKQNPDELVTSAAYVLFYRRRDAENANSSSIVIKNGGMSSNKEYA